MKRMRESHPEFSLSDLLQSFIDVIGEGGTLLLPLFNFAFCNGSGFNRATTPSSMGALTEAARVDRRFVRTRHAIYSFAVTGPLSDEFSTLSNVSALADDGPFGLLRRRRGKIAVLDLDDQNSMTMYHHIEEVNGVTYRYHKSFTGKYCDLDQTESLRQYSLFVWDEVRGVRTDVNRAGELLWSQGLYSGSRPGVDSGLRVIDAQAMFLSISDVIRRGDAVRYLYSMSMDSES
jgi:aminoglycoside 3-N-acetyltransferase